MEGTTTKVAVVVEDDDDIRDLVRTVLQQSGFTVHACANGLDGLATIEAVQPHVITLDIGLPDVDGFEVARRIRKFSNAYIVMLTSRAEELDAVIGLEIGADDYVTKPFRPRELRARIDRIMHRRRPVGPPVPAAGSVVWKHNQLELDEKAHTVSINGEPVRLTVTEFRLLRQLLSGGNRVHAKSGLLGEIRADQPGERRYVPGSDDRLLEVHIANLRRKLGDDPKQPRWIETVRGVGYRLAPEKTFAEPQPIRSGLARLA
jgi:DNA-binding response OmpR family regulator